MGFLQEVIVRKKERLAREMQLVPETCLVQQIADAQPCRDLCGALLARRPAVIAEFKRSSPSKGAIRHDRTPEDQAAAYELGGAAVISVLTEEDYFHGSGEDLQRVAATSNLPILRKDFIFHPYQLLQARAWGADAVLLIVRLVGKEGLAELLSLALALGLTPLVEVHDEAELEIALALQAPLLGINNRNLEALVVDPETTPRLMAHMPASQIVVGESGLRDPAEIRRLCQLGVTAVLIGEALMRAADPAAEIRRLRGDGSCSA